MRDMPKGWERLSIQVNTRPNRMERDITRRDLLIPVGRDRLALLGACLVCGICLSVFWVYIPAFLITPFVGQLDGWLWAAMSLFAVASTCVLYTLGRTQEEKAADWAEKV
jgi:hypothetical protein